jgi:hypothetical protein
MANRGPDRRLRGSHARPLSVVAARQNRPQTTERSDATRLRSNQTEQLEPDYRRGHRGARRRKHLNDKPPRSLSRPHRGATYESYGDIPRPGQGDLDADAALASEVGWPPAPRSLTPSRRPLSDQRAWVRRCQDCPIRAARASGAPLLLCCLPASIVWLARGVSSSRGECSRSPCSLPAQSETSDPSW